MNRLAKVALWTGVSLCCVAVIEAGQEMVKAMVLHLPQPAPEKMTNNYAHTGSPTDSTDFQLRPSGQIIAQATQQATQPSATHEKLAINTGSGNDPQQHITQMTPKQVAANTWNGASFPVENFQAYTSPFGYRTSATGGYNQEFHYGLDMAAPEGSYIRTWWTGKVVEVSDDTNCGTSVVVESGPWQHIYCHMQGHVETENGKRYMIDREGGIQIWQGQQLQAGARLGRVGMTGRTTGPHLHWGLKYNSNWVDPALVLRAMYDNQRTATANTSARSTE